MRFQIKKPKWSLVRCLLGLTVLTFLAWSVGTSHFSPPHPSQLARLTTYWPSETRGDAYTKLHKSSTGVKLREGHCAVDPHIIPYGSIVNIEGVGKFLAVDTGAAVVKRHAARKFGQTSSQRNALVVDIYLPSGKAAKKFIKKHPKFVKISWTQPSALTPEDRQLFPNEDWSKLSRF